MSNDEDNAEVDVASRGKEFGLLGDVTNNDQDDDLDTTET